MERRVQLSWCKSYGVLCPLASAESPLHGFEFFTNGFAGGVQAEVNGEASTAELVQNFCRALPTHQSPLFKGLNFC